MVALVLTTRDERNNYTTLIIHLANTLYRVRNHCRYHGESLLYYKLRQYFLMVIYYAQFALRIPFSSYDRIRTELI